MNETMTVSAMPADTLPRFSQRVEKKGVEGAWMWKRCGRDDVVISRTALVIVCPGSNPEKWSIAGSAAIVPVSPIVS